MANKEVKIKISVDEAGNAITKYELTGFPGTSCEDVGNLMAQMGTVSDKKTTDDAYQYKVPLPVPNSVKS